MSITPRGMSIQEAYRNYAEGRFLVNRRYQRKLVWTVQEKEFLIDSIIQDLPIPLILLAQAPSGNYEIIDGLQRLNAILSYIENRFSLRGKYFDANQFSRAKQRGDTGAFEYKDEDLLSPELCANILDYQLAVTIYPSVQEDVVTDIFGRINSGGKQLSPQEKRQAGMLDLFAEVVRKLSSEIRGDSSEDLVGLGDMPQISIDSSRENLGYGLKAEEIFWCTQGVLWKSQLRDSEDEELLADIVASIVRNEPIPRSKELFDKLYSSTDDEHLNIVKLLANYGADRLIHEVKVTFSILRKIFDTEDHTIRDIVNPQSFNPVKGSFYGLFMAIFHLVVKEEKSPVEFPQIIQAVAGLQKELISSAKYSKTEDRVRNINKTIGLIQPYFVTKDPPVLRHGSGLSIDFENSLRRTKVETNRYECKQGLIDLSSFRRINFDLYDRIVESICGIANLGPDADGFLFIGVADSRSDANRIQQMDGVEPIEIAGRFVVGIDREANVLGANIDSYIDRLLSRIRNSELTEPLKTQVVSQTDIIDYKELSVVRLRIPRQSQVSFVGSRCFTRRNSTTVELEGPELLAINNLFG